MDNNEQIENYSGLPSKKDLTTEFSKMKDYAKFYRNRFEKD